ncbi:hypothetical protein FRC04_007684 [Tulasnella sp. 424]|nr:hypothetical protein FRC04_007684 [Tulasnella sp. 424]KAG8979114.1 hypothetical protein FRC05_009324 [Tulasnella sp. 425]
MSSATITPRPTASPTYTTSTLTGPVTTTTNLYDIPVDDPIGGARPVQSYIYPTVAFAVALVVAVQVCRLMERKRLRQRQAAALMLRADEHDADAALARLPPPAMYTVYLEKQEWAEQRQITGWSEIMPLSSNLVVKSEKSNPTADAELGSGAHGAIQKTKAAIKGLGHGVLVALDTLALYDLHAAEERRREAARQRAEESDERETIDPRLPRDLVAGILIAMPSSARPPHAQQQPQPEVGAYEEEQLPDVAIGIMEKSWQGGVD